MKNSISGDRAWIIIFDEYLTTEEELVLTNGFTKDEEPARIIGFIYTK